MYNNFKHKIGFELWVTEKKKNQKKNKDEQNRIFLFSFLDLDKG